MSQNRPGTPFRLFRGALDDALKDDPIVDALLGRDQNGWRKVFEVRATKDDKAPFVMWRVIPGDKPEGHFKDLKSMEIVMFQLSNWGRNLSEAWEVFSATEEALDRLDIDVEIQPYKLIQVIRLDASPIPDDTTSWYQISATYRAVLSR
jgi:hypothetical protein